MYTGRIFDLLAALVIGAAGLATAYVCFGFLSSQAEGEFYGYSVGGAIAGFLVSAGLLTSIYLQFRKSSDELQNLRVQNQELQAKLIRGAPRPTGFETEVAERQRLVLARPGEWELRGGVIFDFVLPQEMLQDKSNLPARFVCSHYPVLEEYQSPQEFYQNYQETIPVGEYVESHSCEFIFLGGETEYIESLKIIAREYARIELQPLNPLTGKETPAEWFQITKEEYEYLKSSQTEAADPSTARAGWQAGPETQTNDGDQTQGEANDVVDQQVAAPDEQTDKDVSLSAPRIVPAIVLRMKVVCYHEALQTIFDFDFTDDASDFVRSSRVFNRLLASVRFLT